MNRAEIPEHNLALDLVRITEAAALASARWLGRGDKQSGDRAAVEAMRLSFSAMQIRGRVIIGEGEKDRAPMLYNGEEVGTGTGPEMDVAVDPVEGTKLLATGRPNAISVTGMAPGGSISPPGPSHYMRKMVVHPGVRDRVDPEAPVPENLSKIASALDKSMGDLVVFVLDKPRHQGLIQQIREAGARIQLHSEGDVAGALMAVDPLCEVDLLLGTGGTPEGILSACAIRAMGGEMYCSLDPQSEEERKALQEQEADLDRILTTRDLIQGEDVYFSATGISGGTFLPGVRYSGNGAVTHSLVTRGKTGTLRRIEATHSWDRLMRFSAVEYGPSSRD